MNKKVRDLIISKLEIGKILGERVYFKSIQERYAGRVVNKRFYKVEKNGVISINVTQPSISKISDVTFNQAHAQARSWLSGKIDFATKEEYEAALKEVKKQIGIK